MIEIAPVGREDLPQLAALFAELVETKTDLAAMAENFSLISGDPGYILLAAKDGQQLVGTIMGIVCLDMVGSCRPFMVIENVVVAGSHRRRGVAAALFRELEAQARERQCYYTMLVTADWRQEALAFYTAMGYETGKFRGLKKYLPAPGEES